MFKMSDMLKQFCNKSKTLNYRDFKNLCIYKRQIPCYQTFIYTEYGVSRIFIAITKSTENLLTIKTYMLLVIYNILQ